jgi:hypothetical protein
MEHVEGYSSRETAHSLLFSLQPIAVRRLGVVVAVSALAIAGCSRATPTNLSTSKASSSSSAQMPATPSALRPADSTGPSSPCDVSAAGTVPQANGGGASFPPAETPAAGSTPMSESDATSVARAEAGRFGGTSPAPATASAAASEMSYASFLSLSGWAANPSINPQRCVWVVSVQAPISEKPAPGAPQRIHDQYTVVLDVGSGVMVGLIEGQSLVQ